MLVHIIFGVLFAFGILTLWVPAVWPASIFEAGTFLLCLFVLWRKWPARIPYPAWPLLFAVAWGLVQLRAHWSAYAFDTEVALLRWGAFLCVFVIAYCLFVDAGPRSWFRHAMLWFGFLVSVWATLESFTSGGKIFWIFPTENSFVMGPILYHNHYAAFVEIVLPIALFEALRREGNALLYTGMAAALYGSVLASTSRAGTILTTAEILVVVILMMARGYTTGRDIGVAALRILVVFGVFTVVVGWERVWERFWQPDPMQVRREFAESTLRMIAAHPLTGTGLGTWPTVYPHFALVDIGLFANQAHNDWLQFFSEGGILFGLAILSIFLWILRPAFRSIWGIGAIAVFLHAIVDFPFSLPALGAWTMLMVGMLAARQATTKKQSATNGVSRNTSFGVKDI